MKFYKKTFASYLILGVINDALCRTTNKMDAFIVGGKETLIEYFPHSVFLAVFFPSSSLCGSSILNQDILLSAAHCVNFKGNFDISVYAGHENLDQTKVTRKISKFVVHPRYNYNTDENDLVILFLDKVLPFGTYIKRVIISAQFPNIDMVSIAGWGKPEKYSASHSQVLKMTKQKLLEKYRCFELSRAKEGVLCAGDISATNDYPAQGDSGSALITDSYQQIGIVSYTMNVHPALIFYTNVSYYYPWIKSTSQLYICS